MGARTVVFSAPQGWGKSMRAKELQAEFGCASVVDYWYPPAPFTKGALHLTHCPPKDLKAVSRIHTVIGRGWDGSQQRGYASTTLNWLMASVLVLVLGLAHYLDDAIPDHHAEQAQADDLQAAIVASISQGKFERAAQAVCGPQAAWEQLRDGAVQCKTKYGKPTITVQVSP